MKVKVIGRFHQPPSKTSASHVQSTNMLLPIVLEEALDPTRSARSPGATTAGAEPEPPETRLALERSDEIFVAAPKKEDKGMLVT